MNHNYSYSDNVWSSEDRQCGLMQTISPLGDNRRLDADGGETLHLVVVVEMKM